MHRDVKMENFFLNDDVIILGDFGLSKEVQSITSTLVGTPLTNAPEIIFKHRSYTSLTDLWSIGCCYYFMLFGDYPFDPESNEDLKYKIMKESG